MSPKINKNSKVIIKAKSEYKNGDIVCIYLEDIGIIARMLNINGENYIFSACNLSYQPIVINKREGKNLIFGEITATVNPI